MIGESLNWVKKGVWFIRVKYFIAIHHGNQVLSVRKVDDVMRVAWEHVNHLNLFATHLKLDYIISTQFAFLNQTMTGYYNEELPLGIMPVLSLCDAWL